MMDSPRRRGLRVSPSVHNRYNRPRQPASTGRRVDPAIANPGDQWGDRRHASIPRTGFRSSASPSRCHGPASDPATDALGIHAAVVFVLAPTVSKPGNRPPGHDHPRGREADGGDGTPCRAGPTNAGISSIREVNRHWSGPFRRRRARTPGAGSPPRTLAGSSRPPRRSGAPGRPRHIHRDHETLAVSLAPHASSMARGSDDDGISRASMTLGQSAEPVCLACGECRCQRSRPEQGGSAGRYRFCGGRLRVTFGPGSRRRSRASRRRVPSPEHDGRSGRDPPPAAGERRITGRSRAGCRTVAGGAALDVRMAQSSDAHGTGRMAGKHRRHRCSAGRTRRSRPGRRNRRPRYRVPAEIGTM